MSENEVCGAVNDKLFLKISRGWSLNNETELKYQFKWLINMHEAVPDHFPSVIAIVKIDGKIGYVMERVDGTDLTKLVMQNVPYLIERQDTVIRQLTWAVLAMHDSGYTHNDIHPGNVILLKSGLINLIDPFTGHDKTRDERMNIDLFGINEVGNYIERAVNFEVQKTARIILKSDAGLDEKEREYLKANLPSILNTEHARNELKNNLTETRRDLDLECLTRFIG